MNEEWESEEQRQKFLDASKKLSVNLMDLAQLLQSKALEESPSMSIFKSKSARLLLAWIVVLAVIWFAYILRPSQPKVENSVEWIDSGGVARKMVGKLVK